jgi:predicted phage terminase large subunit-like protein
VPDGGAIWLREWFKSRYSWTQAQEALQRGGLAGLKRELHLSRIVQTIDCANKKGSTNDYSVIATWGRGGDGRFYLLNVWRDRVDFPELQDAAFDQYALWHPSAQHIEDAANGTPLIQQIRAQPSGEEALRRRQRWGFTRIPVEAYQAEGDKEARARAVTPLARNGLVVLPSDECPWLEEWLREHERFPLAKHDDQVDTTSMGLEILRDADKRRIVAW